ncbi:MAG: tetratricopeptide repeat protein, partial [Bacteroidia bacterium]
MKSAHRYIITLLLALSILKIKGQKNTDSLIQIISSTPSDTIKIKLYNRLSIIYSQTNASLSKNYADSALTEISINEPKHKNNIYFYEISKAMAYNNIGSTAFQQGKFNYAVQYCIKALKIYETNHSDRNIARLQNNLGSILKAIGNFKEALYYHRKCAKIKEKFYAEKKTKSTTFA